MKSLNLWNRKDNIKAKNCKDVHQMIQWKIVEANEAFLKKQCKEMKCVSFNLHTQVKELIGTERKKKSSIIKNKKKNLIPRPP